MKPPRYALMINNRYWTGDYHYKDGPAFCDDIENAAQLSIIEVSTYRSDHAGLANAHIVRLPDEVVRS